MRAKVNTMSTLAGKGLSLPLGCTFPKKGAEIMTETHAGQMWICVVAHADHGYIWSPVTLAMDAIRPADIFRCPVPIGANRRACADRLAVRPEGVFQADASSFPEPEAGADNP